MANSITDMLAGLTAEEVQRELQRVGEQDLVLRSLLRGILARDRERQHHQLADAVEKSMKPGNN